MFDTTPFRKIKGKPFRCVKLYRARPNTKYAVECYVLVTSDSADHAADTKFRFYVLHGTPGQEPSCISKVVEEFIDRHAHGAIFRLRRIVEEKEAKGYAVVSDEAFTEQSEEPPEPQPSLRTILSRANWMAVHYPNRVGN